ncbi:unnamed protein product, partial [Mesorhabditis spiculigera]
MFRHTLLRLQRLRAVAQSVSSPQTSLRQASAWINPMLSNLDAKVAEEVDAERLFTTPQVHELLQKITGVDLENKVFRSRRISNQQRRSHFALMTDERLENTIERMKDEAQLFLQFVPLKEPREIKTELLAHDEEIAGFDSSRFVFTDISFDATDQNRTVVVREIDGKLRTATPEEHDRMNRTYYNKQNRPVVDPAVFSDPWLDSALARDEHEFVMDWACLYYEADDPKFVETTKVVFDRTIAANKFDVFYSTRHFGTLVFYMALNNNLPPLLNYFAGHGELRECALLVRLQKTLYPEWRTAIGTNDTDLKIVQDFVKQNPRFKPKLTDLTKFLAQGGQKPFKHAVAPNELKSQVGARLLASEKNIDVSRTELAKICRECEEQEHALANLGDVDTAVHRVLGSLEDHIKTLRMSENSLTVNQTILQYEAAKTRATTLLKCISAGRQYEKAWESLKEVSKEDQATMLGTLQELQSSIDVIRNLVPTAAMNVKDLEDQKDAFLAWQSTAFFLALQQGDTAKIAEIHSTYASLDRKKEFVAIFSKGVSNRFANANFARTSASRFLECVKHEIENQMYIFFGEKSGAKREFLDSDECILLVKAAMKKALAEYGFKAVVTEILHAENDPLAYIYDLEKSVPAVTNALPDTFTEDMREMANELLLYMRDTFLDSAVDPLTSALIKHVQSKVDAMDLVTGSHRTRIAAFSSACHDIIHLFDNSLTRLPKFFEPATIKQLLQRPVTTAVDAIINKAKNWNFARDSQGKTRPIDDLIKVNSAAGQLIAGLSRLKISAEKLEIDAVRAWNSRVCDATLKNVATAMSGEVQRGVAEVKEKLHSGIRKGVELPSYAMMPSEYITKIAQEVLQSFHKFEVFFADDNITHSFAMWTDVSEEREEDLLMKVMRDLCAVIVRSFIETLGDVSALPPVPAKQLFCDAGYFRDALQDLRIPAPALDEVITKLTPT